MFVIMCTSGRYKGYYVALPGSAGSYNGKLELARKFATEEEARKELCPENERIVDVTELLKGGER